MACKNSTTVVSKDYPADLWYHYTTEHT